MKLAYWKLYHYTDMTALKLKYAASIIIILIHFFGCKQSWDLRVQEDFLNLLRSKNDHISENTHFDKGYQISKWADSEIKVSLVNSCQKNIESNLEVDQLQIKLPGNIGKDLISRIDQITINFLDTSIQFK